MRILDLSSNKLTELTSQVIVLSFPVKLFLIRIIFFFFLFVQIGLLGSLHELLCSFNFIEIIPPEIGRLKNLTIFSIASNKITQLPVEMSGLVQLKVKAKK